MKAIALISGGLDSTLATRIMQRLGLQLLCLNTLSPFCLCNHRSAGGCFHGAGQVARELNLRLISINVAEEFLQIVKKPKHGYGSHLNPCIDCRILLFKKAKELMLKEQASFVITGEVLGQRPMSQRLETLKLIEQEAGLSGLVLRPLSARILEPTIPEQEGWVAREKLLTINGRGRREQIALAAEFGINDYPCPSGGCLLTDPQFSKRLKDLMKDQELNLADIELLKIGRHFRLASGAKLIVGRDEKENKKLEGLARVEDYLFLPCNELAGPTSLGRGAFNDKLIKLSCSITARYCDLNGNKQADIVYYRATKTGTVPEGDCPCLKVAPLSEDQLSRLRI